MNNKNLIVAAVTLTVVLFATISFNLVVNQIADRVIQKLNYVPGPYQPGFDPDKVDPAIFRSDFSKAKFLED